MSITDELREWFKDRFFMANGWQEIHDIADRIDAEHESKVAEVASGWDYWESTHVELPKDANGEYIHIGDEICGYGWPNGGVYCRAIVNEVTILVGPQDGAYRGWLMWAANECRHYHAPTVEDVLREFAERYLDYEGVPSAGRRGIGEALMDEYASKLRLAEGEDA